MAIIAVDVRSDHRGYADRGVLKATGSIVRIAGIHIVHADVFSRGSNDGSLGKVRRQDKSVNAHEILDVGHTKLVLNGKASRAKILISIKHIHESNDGADASADRFEFVADHADRFGNAHLERVSRAGQRAGLREGVPIADDAFLDLVDHGLVGLADGEFSTILRDRFDGHALGIFLQGHIGDSSRGDGSQGVRDLIAFSDRAGLKGDGSVVCFEDSPRSLFNRAGYVQDLQQAFPIRLETAYKVDCSCGRADVCGLGGVRFNCHFYLSLLK